MGKTVSAPMTKGLLMDYTFYALFVIAFLSYIAFGLSSLLICIVTVGVAVLCEILLSKFMGKKNLMSAAVFGLIVALSYSLGYPTMMQPSESPIVLMGNIEQYLLAALISAVGLIVFKKLQGLTGRKYVNPAAIAKLLILGLLFVPVMTSISEYSVLLPEDHLKSGIDLQNNFVELIYEGVDYSYYPMEPQNFGPVLISCYSANPMNVSSFLDPSLDPALDALYTMLVAKVHGWIGGFSSILVIVMGIVLFWLARGYMKWRITIAYFVSTAVLAVAMNFMFGGDLILRLIFHLFMGSSIFMAFFMATDPATTPLTRLGQIIFGVGLGVLTVVIQTFTGFLGGSILALVIMNLATPLLDKVGVPKPSETRLKIKLPKAKKFTDVETTDCIRCGRCLTACCRNLPVIMIKEAVDKCNWEKAEKLGAGYCDNCGHCSFVCPARIDLRTIVVSAKDKIKNQ